MTKQIPLIRWAGSKRKLLPNLSRYWCPTHRRYIEPFMGSACLYFHLAPSVAVLSDTNSELVNAYKELRRVPKLLYDCLTALLRDEETYYHIRSVDPLELSRLQRAVRFFYLNRFCFNGLYRTNLTGAFNVPYGAARTGDFPPLVTFMRAAALLKTARLSCNDFENILDKEVARRDFVYLDPPYAVENRRIFKQYGPTTFGQVDMNRLADLLRMIDKRGASFVLSYADCREAQEAFGEWTRTSTVVARNIAGFAGHRKKAREVIFTNCH